MARGRWVVAALSRYTTRCPWTSSFSSGNWSRRSWSFASAESVEVRFINPAPPLKMDVSAGRATTIEILRRKSRRRVSIFPVLYCFEMTANTRYRYSGPQPSEATGTRSLLPCMRYVHHISLLYLYRNIVKGQVLRPTESDHPR